MKLFCYALLVIAGFLVASLAGFWLAVRPPRLVIPFRPSDYKLPAEEVTLTTGDGLRLSAWLIPGARAAAIILLHGYPAERRRSASVSGAMSGARSTS